MPFHPTLYIAMPCCYEQAVPVNMVNMVIGKLLQLQDSAKISADSAMLFSEDGSKGDTWRIIESAHRQCPCYFEVKAKAAGESHFSPSKLINASLDAITSFSVAPWRAIMSICPMVFLIGIAMIAWTVVDAFRGITPGGYASLVRSLWFLGGLGIICLGVVREYHGKLYKEAKKCPWYNVSDRLL